MPSELPRVVIRPKPETLALMQAQADAAHQTVPNWLLSTAEAALSPSSVADPAVFVPQHPTKAAPGQQIWHAGGLKAELQDLANKRGVDLDSLLAGCADLERQLRPSVRHRPLTSLPKLIGEPARPRR
jgi:hypothetical protein